MKENIEIYIGDKKIGELRPVSDPHENMLPNQITGSLTTYHRHVMQTFETKDLIFIKAPIEATGLKGEDEELVKVIITFIQEKIDEGYEPVLTLFEAGGVIFKKSPIERKQKELLDNSFDILNYFTGKEGVTLESYNVDYKRSVIILNTVKDGVASKGELDLSDMYNMEVDELSNKIIDVCINASKEQV